MNLFGNIGGVETPTSPLAEAMKQEIEHLPSGLADGFQRAITFVELHELDQQISASQSKEANLATADMLGAFYNSLCTAGMPTKRAFDLTMQHYAMTYSAGAQAMMQQQYLTARLRMVDKDGDGSE